LFTKKRSYAVAFHFFKKAEAIAKAIKNYLLLTHIYDAIIRIAPETDFINPEVYIEKRNGVENRLQKAREIEDLIALTRYRIKCTQLFEDEEGEDFLSVVLETYFKDKEIQASPELRRELIEAGMLAFLEKRDYEGLSIFLLQQTRQKAFQVHIQEAPEWGIRILTTLANALFKQKQYKHSLEIAQQIQELLPKVKNHARYLFFYYNLLVVNYSVLDIEKALFYAQQILTDPVLKKESYYRLFAHLNSGLLFYKKQELRKAIRHVNQAIQEEAFRSMSPRFRLKTWMTLILLWVARREYTIAQEYSNQVEKAKLTRYFSPNDQRMWTILRHIFQGEKVSTDLVMSVQDDEDQILSYEQWLRNQGYRR
jgi:tetratricopeptide (TPR) repeat protein